MPIEHIDIEIKLVKQRRERVHLVLDPRGFFKTVPVLEWFIGIDPAGGEDYATMSKWLKDKMVETYFLPREHMEGLNTNRATSDRGLTLEFMAQAMGRMKR